MAEPDVLIIGGGVIGCAVAFYLTRQGPLRIMVVERGSVGCGASNAAAGVLAVASTRAPGGALFELRRRSAAMFPDLVAALRADGSVDPQYQQHGLLMLGFSVEEESALRDLVVRRREQGLQAEFIEAQAARGTKPWLPPQTRAAGFFAGDHAINNQRLTAALADYAQRRGVEFRLGTPATAFESSDSRVLRVRVGDDWISPAAVVIAAGAWCRELGALLRVRVPVRPARGEMVALRPRERMPSCTITWGDGYLVPRPDGELLVGSTTQYCESTEATAQGVTTLLSRALHMMPALKDAALVRCWAGLRPCPTIRRPIIAPVRGFDNLVLAAGHHRNGILLAPITGQLVAELITRQATCIPIDAFCYRPR